MEISQQIKDHVHQSFHQQAFLTLIDAKLEHVEKGAVRVSCCYRDDLTQQNGYFHGGVITTLADVSCGYAAMSSVPLQSNILTVEFKINIIRPVTSNKIIASAQVIKSGKTLIVVESTVTDETGSTVVAKMVATMFRVDEE